MNSKRLKISFNVLIIVLCSLICPAAFATADREGLPPDLARSTAYYYKEFTATLEGGETVECSIPFVNHIYFNELEKKYGAGRRSHFLSAPSASSAENILQSPFSPETIETEDPPFNPYRKKAFAELKELYEICSDAKSGNFGERYEKAARKVYGGMLHNYANYSDICLAARLCLLDAIAAEYGGLFLSGSPFFFEYEQIKENYAHEPNSTLRSCSISDEIDYGRGVGSRFKIMDANQKKLLNSIHSRLAGIKANDGAVAARIDELKAETARAFETAREAGIKIRSGKNRDAATDEYIDAARKILNAHIALYESYMETGRYKEAHGVFSPTIDGGRVEFKGAFVDADVKISDRDHYGAAGAGGGDAFSKRLERLYAETLYQMIFSYRLNETARPVRSEADGGGPGLAARIKACCEFVDAGTNEILTPSSGAAYAEVSKNMGKTAFGFVEKGFEKYFVSTPAITAVMITLDEMRPNGPHMIIDPFDVITIRAVVDHRKSRAPFYSIESVMSAPSSGRKKTAILKFEYFNGSFFSKFQPNESREEETEESSLIGISEEQKNPRPLPENISAEIDDDITAAEARRKEIEKNSRLAPYLKRGHIGEPASGIERKRLAAIFDECINGRASQSKTDYSVEIIAAAPRSLEAAYAVDFMEGSRWQAPARALYKELFREHFDAPDGNESGESLGKIILAYFMADGLGGTILDDAEAGYLSRLGKTTLKNISERPPSEVLSALANLFMIILSDEGMPEKACAKFVEKYPGHPALPLVELKIIGKKAAWSKKGEYDAILSELDRLSEKYKTVKIPFSDTPFGVEFDYWKIRLLLKSGRAEEAKKIFPRIKKDCAGWPKFQEFIDDFDYMDENRSLDKE